MLKLHHAILFAIFALIALASCTPELEDYQGNVEGPKFFPLAVGNSWIYRVDSVIYDNKGLNVDSVSGYIRETITSQYMDSAGDKVFRIERSSKKVSVGGWEVISIWTASKNEKTAYKTENNLKFLKLTFPVLVDKSWEGNIYFPDDIVVRIAGEPIKMYQNWGKYKYTGVDESLVLEGLQYDGVASVLQADIENKISKRYSIEKYARNIGLIYKEMWILDTQKSESQASWEVKAEEGFILKERLISFTPGPNQ